MRSVLLLTSVGEEAERIAAHCRVLFDDIEIYQGEWGEPLPEACLWWRGDLLVSYCSRWKLPESLLSRAGRAMNFHPAPPWHRGAGGLNWALYLGEQQFGVTCHDMAAEVDAGDILDVRTFPILSRDDANTLYARTHLHLEYLANDILLRLAAGADLRPISQSWSGPIRRRRQLDELATLTMQMPEAEIMRRIRATSFKMWQPSIQVGDRYFELRPQPVMVQTAGQFSETG